jgi:hypothetical protein
VAKVMSSTLSLLAAAVVVMSLAAEAAQAVIVHPLLESLPVAAQVQRLN